MENMLQWYSTQFLFSVAYLNTAYNSCKFFLFSSLA